MEENNFPSQIIDEESTFIKQNPLFDIKRPESEVRYSVCNILDLFRVKKN